MHTKNKTSIIVLLYTFILAIIIVSCTPKPMDSFEESLMQKPIVEISDSDSLLSFYKETSNNSVTTESLSPEKSEIEGLRYILDPSFRNNPSIYINSEGKDFLEKILLTPDNANLFLNAEDWKRVISILFSDINISTTDFLSTYKESDSIKRQDAIPNLMNLISLGYSIDIEDDLINLQKSYIITDLDGIPEKNQLLIRNAFCLGFTDSTVETLKTFRPEQYLTRNEAISMLYRIFSNLGYPINSVPEDDTNLATGIELESSDSSGDLCTFETILDEYTNYVDKITESGNSKDKKRLSMLNKTEEIVTEYNELHISNTTLNKENWIRILTEVFELEPEEINLYLMCETENTISYDSISMAVFGNPKILGQSFAPKANKNRLENAREAIPQFDTTKDKEKFSQMHSSGLLDGIYQIPGFTPQRPVTNAETIILIKRIVENISF